MAAHSFEHKPVLSALKVPSIAEGSLSKRKAGKSKVTKTKRRRL